MDEKLRFLRKKWGELIVFGLIFGVVTHGMILFNDLPNGDGLLSNYYTFQRTITSGRWLLGIACLISGPFTVPVINGIISIILVTMSAILIIDLFNVNQKINQVFIVALMVSFPTLASGLLYMFTVDGYMISLFLSIFAIWILHRSKIKIVGELVSIVCIAGSMGIYQAYISVTMTICILNCILLILKNEKKVLKIIIEYLTCGILGAILYFVLLKVILGITGLKLVEYQGIVGAATPLTISEMLLRIKVIYVQSILTFCTRLFINKLFVVLILAQWIIILYYIICEKEIKDLLKIIICFLALPVCLLPIYLTSTDVDYHLLMKYSWVLIYIYILVLAERLNLSKVMDKLIIIFTCIIIYGFMLGNNSMYEYASLRYDRTIMLLNRIQVQLESGQYNMNKKVGIFYEGDGDEKYQIITKIYPYADKKYIDVYDYNAEATMKLYFTDNFKYMERQQCIKYENTKEYQQMKLKGESFKIFETKQYIIVKVNSGIKREGKEG